MVVMITYIYGAICLKYVSGAESLDAGVSYTIWADSEGLKKFLGRGLRANDTATPFEVDALTCFDVCPRESNMKS